jgi:DNA polymerase III alpha subunit
MSARIRTGYSFRKAAGHLTAVAAVLKEQGRTHALITDTASTYGWVQWGMTTLAAGMKPVFGVELAVSHDIKAKRPTVDYWTFIARDDLRPLHDLIGIATEQFRYEPLLTVEQAAGSASTLNVIMGHRSAVAEIEPRPHLWFGVGPAVSPGQWRRVLKSEHRFVAVSDNRFPRERDRSLYELACGRRSDTQSYPQWILSDKEWLASMSHLEEFGGVGAAAIIALDNRDDILEASTATLQRAEMAHPDRPYGLLEMCQRGAERLGVNLGTQPYAARLRRELELIVAKKFEDYFYMVADIVNVARSSMMVGPARGSSCGSLVCYLLGITSVDPIPFGLLFERFIDVNRADLPDIDIDFSEQHRDIIFRYVRDKYGSHRVARLGTVNLFQARSALKAAAFALDIPPWSIASLADQAELVGIEQALAGHLLNRTHPEIALAAQLEGHPSHAGQHPAGIVITAGPVADVVAIDRRTGATMCDYRDAEALNLLKIDMLGLTQLSVFEDALELANLASNALGLLSPYDDRKALHIINSRRYAGIFQFNGQALQNLANQITITSIDDIVALTALARPGPLDSGEAQRWVRIRLNKEAPSYIHPLFEPILKPTLGVVIYQEQIMQICRAVGMSWEEVSAVRRLISKSAGPEALDKHQQSFKLGAIKHGASEKVADEVWDVLRASGAYSFNKSHAVAYGIISYWCCWLKGHYPLEFAAATLSHASEDTQIKLLRELEREGIGYIPADKNVSIDKWTVGDVCGQRKLVGPLSNIIGIGPKHQAAILSARSRPMEKLPDRIGKLLASPRTKIDNLYPVRTEISRLMPDPKALNIASQPVEISKVQTNGEKQLVMVFGRVAELREKIVDGIHSLNLWIEDDSDRIFAKVGRYDFDQIGKEIMQHGEGYYAIKGTVPAGFRMIWVEAYRFIGAGHGKQDRHQDTVAE